MAGWRKAVTLASLTIRGSLLRMRGGVLVLLAFTPVFSVIGLIAARVSGFSLDVYQLLGVSLSLQVVLVFVALLIASGLFRDEIEEETLTYLTTRSISKPTIVLAKYAGYVLAATVVLLPPLALSFFLTVDYLDMPLADALPVLSALLGATVLGVLAYGAFFLLLGLLTRRALSVGLLYAFIWEFLLGLLPGQIPKLSVMHYLRSLGAIWVESGPMHAYPTDLTLAFAIAGPVGVAIAGVALSIVVFLNTGFVATRE